METFEQHFDSMCATITKCMPGADLELLRQRMTAEALLGKLAFAAGIIDQDTAVSAKELAGEFSWQKLRREDICLQLQEH